MAKCPKCNKELPYYYLNYLEFIPEYWDSSTGYGKKRCPNCQAICYLPFMNCMLLLLEIVFVFLLSYMLISIVIKDSRIAIYSAIIIAFIFQYTVGWKFAKLKAKD